MIRSSPERLFFLLLIDLSEPVPSASASPSPSPMLSLSRCGDRREKDVFREEGVVPAVIGAPPIGCCQTKRGISSESN